MQINHQHGRVFFEITFQREASNFGTGHVVEQSSDSFRGVLELLAFLVSTVDGYGEDDSLDPLRDVVEVYFDCLAVT
ncbi:hypothetical protein D3C85_1549200 [compost metagenome]